MSSDLFAEKQVFKVSELTRDIRGLLEDTFSGVWVEGEISSLSMPQSGHIYFILKDDKAQLRCAFFRRNNTALKCRLEDGMKCIVYGRVSVYDRRGEYQMIVEKAEPQGVGALQLAFEQLKKKLSEEGLFDEKRKRPIPFLPQRIGIVTSGTGAALRDILRVINRRYANVHIVIRPALVQGKTAAQDVAQGIRDLNDYKKIDVIIVGRGGGSLEDLWPFNEEPVARAVFSSRIPVISAVGHEIDFTICDFTADLRAATPTEAAELVVKEKFRLIRDLKNLNERMRQSLLRRLNLCRLSLQRTAKSYALRRPQAVIEQYLQRVDGLEKSLKLHLLHLVKVRTEQLNGLRRRLSKYIVIITSLGGRIQETGRALAAGLRHMMLVKESRTKQISGRLLNLNPLAILARGYSVTSVDGKPLKSADVVKRGDILRTMLNKGIIISRVEDKEL